MTRLANANLVASFLLISACGEKGADLSSKPNPALYGLWGTVDTWVPAVRKAEAVKDDKRKKLAPNAAVPKELQADPKAIEKGTRNIEITASRIFIEYQKDESDPESIAVEFDCTIIHWQENLFQADCDKKPGAETLFTFEFKAGEERPTLRIRKQIDDVNNKHFKLMRLK